MIRTLVFSPFIGIQLAALLQTIWMIGIILELKRFEMNELDGKAKWMLLGGQAVLYATLTVFSVLLLEIGVFWLAGAWTYADWRFHLPSVVLLLFVALQVLIKGSIHKRPLLKRIYFGVVVASFQIYFRWLIPSKPVMVILLEQTLVPFLLILIFSGGIVFFRENTRTDKSTESSEKEKRNTNKTLEKFFSPKVNLIIWILVLFQSMLTYSGYSLLSF